MNILILNWRDPKHPLAGGAELSLLEHAKYWQKKGAKVTWFSSSFEGAKNHETSGGITYIRRGTHFSVHLSFYFYSLFNSMQNYDIIIDCFHFLPFFTPAFIKDKKIVALINEVAGKVWYSNMPFLLAWIGYHIEPLFFKMYKNTQFITASESAKKDLLQMGIPTKNIEIIPHGVTIIDTKKIIKKEQTPTLLFLGRISKDKGIKDVLKAFKEVRCKMKDVRLWIVGKEEQPDYLEKLLTSDFLDLKSSIKYYGFVSQKKKFEILKKSWLLLHASVKEGWGLTVIEAGSQNTPTIGYNVEGLRDSIQNGKTGLLVDSTPDALANGVIMTLSDNRLYKSMTSNVKKWSDTFNWEKSGKESWKIIKQ